MNKRGFKGNLDVFSGKSGRIGDCKCLSKTRERIERRRESVYELYLMSYTQRQISDALTARGHPVAQQTIADDLKILRQRNARWFDHDSDFEMRSMFKEIVDMIDKVINEG